MTFVDISKAYDHADMEDLMDIVWDQGLKGKIWRVAHKLNNNLTARIKTHQGISRKIQRKDGGRQGGKLMTTLFSKMMDTMNDVKDDEVSDEGGSENDGKLTIDGLTIDNLQWVDDVVTFAVGMKSQMTRMNELDNFRKKHKARKSAM